MIEKRRVIIIDDEEIIRAGLENWLSRDYNIIGFESAALFLKSFREFHFEDGIPTCILLDFQMPDMNGVELQKNLKLMNSNFPIIFMSGNAKQADIIDAWHEGAIDFVLKPFTPAHISDVIRKLFETYKNSLANDISSTYKSDIELRITRREAEVLILLGNGRQQQDVAEELGISLRTVKMYRSFLREKLGLETLGELIMFCQKHEASIRKIAKLVST